MSAHALAMELGVPATRIGEIVNCRRRVTPETALRLARYFGGSAKVWLGLQTDFDLAVAEALHGNDIARSVGPAA
jgi:addiction module HigA family antidote